MMASRPNEFHILMASLFDELLLIEHSSNIAYRMSERMSNQAEKDIIEYRAENGPTATVLGSSNTLSIAVLHSPEGFYSRHGETEAYDDVLVKLFRELGGRLQGECLVRVYEVMEIFIADMAGKFYWLKRNEFRSSMEKSFRRKEQNGGKETTIGNEDYYVRFARYQCKHNSNQVVKELCRILPDFQNIQINNWFCKDLLGFYSGLAFCRHKITHRGGIIDPTELHTFSTPVAEWIRSTLQTSVLTGKSTFCLDHRYLRKAVEIIASLGFTLYTEVSKACSMQLAAPIRYGSPFGSK